MLTLERIGGISYQEFCEDRIARRSAIRAGKTIWRFTFRSMLKCGMLYADPHPGNYRFLPDGSVAFLDFGCVKILPPELVAGMKRYMRAAMDGGPSSSSIAPSSRSSATTRTDDELGSLSSSYTMELMVPLCSHYADWQCSPEKARETVAYLSRGIRELAFKDGENLPSIPHVPKMPQDFTFVNRLQWGLASVLAGMRTIAAFRPIDRALGPSGIEPIPN